MIDLKATVPITAWVEYRAPWSCLLIGLSHSYSRLPKKPNLAANVDLSGLLREYMYLNFSASNGHGTALHIIERWTFRTFGSSNSSSYTGNTPSLAWSSWFLSSSPRPACLPRAGAEQFKNLLCKMSAMCRTIQKLVVQDKCSDKAPEMFSMEMLRAMIKGFDSGNIISNGDSGTKVYKRMLALGSQVAVKTFEAVEPCTQAFATELAAVLFCQCHRNLVPLAGWCCDKGELVLEVVTVEEGKEGKGQVRKGKERREKKGKSK